MVEVYCGLELALEVKVILVETLGKMMMKILVPLENMPVFFSGNVHGWCDILMPFLFFALIISLPLLVVLNYLPQAQT